MLLNSLTFTENTLLYRYAMYVDTSRHLAIPILKKHKVRVKFQTVGTKEDSRYVIVLCKVRKKDLDSFENAMTELAEEINNSGYSDYGEFCDCIATTVIQRSIDMQSANRKEA